jgi:hypothetical protein
VDVEQIRVIVRTKLDRDELPSEKCSVTWFGPGSGQRCVVCERTIAPSEIECECEHPRGGVIRFHQACFAVWDHTRIDMTPA